MGASSFTSTFSYRPRPRSGSRSRSRPSPSRHSRTPYSRPGRGSTSPGSARPRRRGRFSENGLRNRQARLGRHGDRDGLPDHGPDRVSVDLFRYWAYLAHSFWAGHITHEEGTTLLRRRKLYDAIEARRMNPPLGDGTCGRVADRFTPCELPAGHEGSCK